MSRGLIWQSETDKLMSLEEDLYYVQIDDDHGVLMLDHSECSDRVTTLLFVGPKNEQLAQSWAQYVQKLNDRLDEGSDEDDLLCDTRGNIKKWLEEVR